MPRATVATPSRQSFTYLSEELLALGHVMSVMVLVTVLLRFSSDCVFCFGSRPSPLQQLCDMIRCCTTWTLSELLDGGSPEGT